MKEISRIGLDIAKRWFQVHGVDGDGKMVVSRKLARDAVLGYFAEISPCDVALEASGPAHYWTRELMKLGHKVRLIPPAYVKPFVKRGKNDAHDAQAICEAAARPDMRFVPVKSEVQQAALIQLPMSLQPECWRWAAFRYGRSQLLRRRRSCRPIP